MDGQGAQSQVIRQWLVVPLLGLGGALLAACMAAPPPKVVQEDQTTSIRLVADSRATTGHSHPTTITQEQLSRVLAGIRIKNDPSSPIGSPVETPPVRAFSADEIRELGPGLITALGSASPEQIVTFYRASPGAVSHQVVTSGGLFVQNGHLYLILANYRIKTDAAPREETVAGFMDIRDHPLIPIVRGGYMVAFDPPESRVQPAQVKVSWNYLDDKKVVVVDLNRLQGRPLKGDPIE